MNRQNSRKLRNQKGMSTLVIVLLLLFVATMVTLYTARTSIREQQVSANQYRADQALSAANLGLDYALAYYTKFSGPDANADGVVDVLTVPAGILTGAGQTVSARVTFVDGDASVDRDGDGDFTNDALDAPHTLTSVGYSDDGSATRTIQIQIDAAGLIPAGGHPGFPLIAKGIAASGGNFTLINRFSHATIWTGADTTALGSAETYVNDPLDPATTRAELIDITGAPDPTQVLHASYSQAGLNSDVIEGDDNLINMTGDQFFESFINENKPTVRAFADSIGQRWDDGQIGWNDLEVSDGVRGIVWIDCPADGEWKISGTMNTLGSEQYPISLFINCDFTTTGTGTPGIDVIGLIYIIGDWDSGGNFEVQGGVIVEGDVDNKGTPTIVFDENLYDGSLGVPPGGFGSVMSGTWKDW
jgi:hypothetical protein